MDQFDFGTTDFSYQLKWLRGQNVYAASNVARLCLVGDRYRPAAMDQPMATSIFLSADAEVALMIELKNDSKAGGSACVAQISLRGFA